MHLMDYFKNSIISTKRLSNLNIIILNIEYNSFSKSGYLNMNNIDTFNNTSVKILNQLSEYG